MDNAPATPPKHSRRPIWIGAGVVVACFLVYVVFHGWPPVDNVSGTIGAANKYRAGQMSEKDVHLQDPEVQKILQNDKIQAI